MPRIPPDEALTTLKEYLQKKNIPYNLTYGVPRLNKLNRQNDYNEENQTYHIPVIFSDDYDDSYHQVFAVHAHMNRIESEYSGPGLYNAKFVARVLACNRQFVAMVLLKDQNSAADLEKRLNKIEGIIGIKITRRHWPGVMYADPFESIEVIPDKPQNSC